VGEYEHFNPLLLASMSVQSVTAHATLCECMLGYLILQLMHYGKYP